MIDLYTDSSPNGFKATIALEEMALPYRLHHVRIDANEHRQPEFLALNPHGRIPVMKDDETGVVLFESAAILLYLAEKTGQLLFQRFFFLFSKHSLTQNLMSISYQNYF